MAVFLGFFAEIAIFNNLNGYLWKKVVWLMVIFINPGLSIFIYNSS